MAYSRLVLANVVADVCACSGRIYRTEAKDGSAMSLPKLPLNKRPDLVDEVGGGGFCKVVRFQERRLVAGSLHT